MKHIAVCLALYATIGCGSPASSSPDESRTTPLTPTPIEPVRSARTLAGAWTGMFDVSSCTGSAEWCRSTNAEPFTLRLDETLRGVAEMEPWRRLPLAVDITQTSSSDGSTILKGVSAISAQPRIDLEIQLEGSAASSLAGSVRYTIAGALPGESTSLVATREGPILFVRQVTTVRAGVLQGTWRGYMNRTACSGDCSEVRDTSEVTLWLSQQGSSLSGTFNRDQLEGTATDREFTLTRTLNTANCRAYYDSVTVCQDSVDFRGSADSLDRMVGTIQRRQSGIDYHDGPFSWTATFELAGVVRSGSSLSR